MTLKITADNIDLGTLTSVTGPKITLVDYPGDDLATTPTGGATVAIAGTGFVNGCQVLVDSTYANTVTFVSSTSISFTTPAMSAGTYPIYVINPDGGTAISIPGISYSGVPAFATNSGSLGTVYEGAAFSSNIAATSDSAVTYSIDSGALPAGFGLNSNTGAIAGNVGTISNSTTYNFTVKATDAELQDTTRNFSITTSPDVVTFNTPAGNQTYSNGLGSSFSLTLDASSTSGRSISYTANTLPTGLSLSGNVIAGTFSAEASLVSLITATVATSLKTATRLLTWSVTAPLPTSMEVLVVAGGGSGGFYYNAGGGGAGAALYASSYTVSGPGTYTITVGGGGAGGGGRANGNNSSFNTAVAIGGGAGGSPDGSIPGNAGGCGGGGAGLNGNSAGEAGGASNQGAVAGFTKYGTAGGSGSTLYGVPYGAGGGGGGCGAPGYSATDSAAPGYGNGGGNGVAGGVGIVNPITGSTTGQLVSSSYYIGGGGGGGSDYTAGNGGLGGGGKGQGNTVGSINGYYGGGGGGSSRYVSASNSNGGAGLVVIAYPNDRKLASATGTYTQTNASGKYIFTFTGSGSLTF